MDELCILLGINNAFFSMLNSDDYIDDFLTIHSDWIEDMEIISKTFSLNMFFLAQSLIEHLKNGSCQEAFEGFINLMLHIPTFRCWHCFKEAVHLSVSLSHQKKKPMQLAHFVFHPDRIYERLCLLYPDTISLFPLKQHLTISHNNIHLSLKENRFIELLSGLQHFGTFYEKMCFQQVDSSTFLDFILLCPPIMRDCRIYNELACKACIELGDLPEAHRYLTKSLYYTPYFTQSCGVLTPFNKQSHYDSKNSIHDNTLHDSSQMITPQLLPPSLYVPYVILYSAAIEAEMERFCKKPLSWTQVPLTLFKQSLMCQLRYWEMGHRFQRNPWFQLKLHAMNEHPELWTALAMITAECTHDALYVDRECPPLFENDKQQVLNDMADLKLPHYDIKDTTHHNKTTTTLDKEQTRDGSFEPILNKLYYLRHQYLMMAITLAFKFRRGDILLCIGRSLGRDSWKDCALDHIISEYSHLNQHIDEFKLRDKRPLRAILFQHAIQWIPELPQSLYALGLQGIYEGSTHTASRYLTEAISKRETAGPLATLAVGLMASQLDDSSIEIQQGIRLLANRYLKKAYFLSKNWTVGFFLALSLFELKSYHDCLILLDQLIIFKPLEPEFRYLKGLCYSQIHNIETTCVLNGYSKTFGEVKYLQTAIYHFHACRRLLRLSLQQPNNGQETLSRLSETTNEDKKNEVNHSNLLSNGVYSQAHLASARTIHNNLIIQRYKELSLHIDYLETGKEQKLLISQPNLTSSLLQTFENQRQFITETSKKHDLMFTTNHSPYIDKLSQVLNQGDEGGGDHKDIIYKNKIMYGATNVDGFPLTLLSLDNPWKVFLYGDKDLLTTRQYSGLSPVTDHLIFSHLQQSYQPSTQSLRLINQGSFFGNSEGTPIQTSSNNRHYRGNRISNDTITSNREQTGLNNYSPMQPIEDRLHLHDINSIRQRESNNEQFTTNHSIESHTVLSNLSETSNRSSSPVFLPPVRHTQDVTALPQQQQHHTENNTINYETNDINSALYISDIAGTLWSN